MKFSKVTKNQGFSLYLEDMLFEKPQGGGGQIALSPSHFLGRVKRGCGEIVREHQQKTFVMLSTF